MVSSSEKRSLSSSGLSVGEDSTTSLLFGRVTITSTVVPSVLTRQGQGRLSRPSTICLTVAMMPSTSFSGMSVGSSWPCDRRASISSTYLLGIESPLPRARPSVFSFARALVRSSRVSVSSDARVWAGGRYG